MKSTIYTTLGVFTTTALAASRTSAPEGCLTVPGDFSTIQAAVDSLPTSGSDPQCIFVEPGTYNEQVLVPSRSAQLSIYGSTEDDTSYASNTVHLVQSKAANQGYSNDETGTLRVKADGFRLYNVDVENSFGEGSQAIALSAYADSGYYGSRFIGYQDTVLANEGYQIYLDSEISGATDFIFGHSAAAWFERVDIRVVDRSIGYVTAHGREDEDESWYVFDHSTIAALDGESVAAGAYWLGRPWREYARVVFQRTTITDVINPLGWRVWNADDPRTDHVYYGEFENTGDGAAGPDERADFATALSAPVAIEEVLGSGYEGSAWFDASYFSGSGAEVGSA